MQVGDSVRHALDNCDAGEWDAAMMNACNAVDGTARKRYPDLGNAARFKQLLRDEVDTLGAMGMPGINLRETRWPVPVVSKLPDKRPDIADVIYGIHRCAHGHGDELPSGFELTMPDQTPDGVPVSLIEVEKGKVRLPTSTIVGLVAVAVFAPENKGQPIPPDHWLSWRGGRFVVRDWWGWAAHFKEIVENAELQQVAMDWGDWWDDWKPM
ncbi:hypothetical protein JVY00_06640 [Tsukamurella tyrosinosolvens]|uniref:hypothetical protein n=1 Tax=Tsukamurella tyrosinosolvens TaxID=57704 RepID=UPI001AF38C92|nr:hypothetical protein [Tsukamurella tyrosinosolvens]QRY85743.1 hypothetical protein JVY00_06640 [Tsukamurella tyrosinosolvens]